MTTRKTSFTTWAVVVLLAVLLLKLMWPSGDSVDRETVAAAISRSQSNATSTVIQPPELSPEVKKEITRLTALSIQDFCVKELRKFGNKKAARTPAWEEAATTLMVAYAVSTEHLEAIKRGSAVIGMSKCGALASWGKPQNVNTTTTKYGTHEQWAYGGHNFLYFDNDRLTTIQN